MKNQKLFNKIKLKNWIGYPVAVGLVALATWLKLLAQPGVIPADVPILYFLAIIPIAIFFGFGPSLLVCVLSFAAYDYFFIPPLHEFTFDSFRETPILIIFLCVGLLFSYLVYNLRKKNREAIKEIANRRQTEAELEKYKEHLEEEVKTRTAELEKANSYLEKHLADHVKTENELKRINRELRAISDCNQIMVRVSDEQILLDEICRIMCGAAGYKMGWIGFVERDEAKSIRPVAWAGHEDGYLKNAAITWADTERGRGPTGMAVRTGQTHFFQDFLTEPAAAPWRESALARGFRSSISVPLKDAARSVFGVFTLYSSQPGYFTSTEIRLLEELAGDIEYGINFLRTKTERDRMEAELKRTAEQWQDTFDAIPEMISIQSKEMSLVRVNKAYEAVTGFRQSSLSGRKCYEIVHCTAGPPSNCPHVQTVNSSKQVTEEFFEPRLDKYLEVSTSPIRNEKGEVTGTVHIAKDITERKKAELELARQKEALQIIMDNAHTHLVLLDKNFNFVALNAAYARTCNKSPEDLIGKNYFYFYPDEENEAIFKRVRETGKPESYRDKPFVFPDQPERGVTYWDWKLTPIKASSGEVNSFVFSLAETTELKRTEIKLKETRDYLDNLFNYANAPIIVWDSQFRINQFNRAFERLTGRNAGEVLGEKLDILFPEESREHAIEHINAALSGQRMESEEIPIRKTDGSIRIVLWDSATIFAQDGTTPVATIAQGQDITERKEAEESLKSRTLELEDTNKQLESFTHSVSHDLREPLRAIDGFTRILNEDYRTKLDDNGRRLLDTILSSTERMGQLITDLMSFSRVSRQYISNSNVDMNAIVRQVVEEVKTGNTGRNIEIRIGDLSPIECDSAMIKQVFSNLIINALKFTRPREKAVIEIGNTSADMENIYYVKDNGVGFDPRFSGKLFNMFQRLHSQDEFEGTGVGLAIVHRVIHRHGGRVWAESEPGKGAAFYFSLPKQGMEGQREGL